MARVTRCASLFLLVTPLLACDVASDDPMDDGAGVRDDVVEPIDAFASMPVQATLPAAGWIELDSSPITPWCGAVLVAPDVVVTSTSCVQAWDKGFLHVGFGEVGRAPLVDVEAVLLQKDAAQPEYALAALRLAEPVRGVTPVDLASAPLHRALCGVQSVAYQYVLDGDPSERWSWQGCVGTDAWLAAKTGAPNCHGDIGAGAFVPSGALLGIVVDARTEGLCSREERLATVADNEAFFDAALDLSRP
jgi:hypothetical protein